MAAIDTLLKYLNPDITPSRNVAIHLNDEKLAEIARDVIIGYEIDEGSRSDWLQINKKSMELITGKELLHGQDKDFPIPKAAKVIYPLISNSIIQSASMLIMHIQRNGQVAECTVLGEDYQRPIPSTQGLNQGNQQQMPQGQQQQQGQPQPQYTLEWVKAAKAKRISDFLNYELLIESESWLEDEHRLMHIVSAWGVGFKEIYYDPATKRNCFDIIPPEDVIINNDTYGSLEKARRITVRKYLSKNDIIEKIRSQEFLDMEFSDLKSNEMTNTVHKNSDRETNPVIECFTQLCYIDLDNDDYEEPYNVYIAKDKKKILKIEPAFEFKQIQVNPRTGKIISIRPTINLVDMHYISAPDGKFYSYGLNHLLFHQNSSITTILRQLIDAGTIRNAGASTGFVSKALKTRERTLRISMGQFVPVELPQGVAIESQIMNLPVQEPSQVLLQLLELLIASAKETGFLTEMLTGQTEMQNVPATTILATLEQATRAFKPVVQKLHRYSKKQFKLWFSNYQKYLDIERYVRFQDQSFQITKDDFDDSIDIAPVADPTMSSEAHKFARINALQQFMAQIPGATNVQEGALRFFTDLQFPNPQALVAPPPPPPPPDPKMIEAQTKAQMAPMQQHVEDVKATSGLIRAAVDHKKADIKEAELGLKLQDHKVKVTKAIVDAHKEAMGVINDQQNTAIEAYNAETKRAVEQQRNEIMDRESRKPSGSEGNSV